MSLSNQAVAKTEYNRPSTPTVSEQQLSQWVDLSVRPEHSGRSLGAYLEIPFLHKRLIFTCVLLSVMAAWAAIVFLPRSYKSVAKMKVRVGRESVALDPSATTTQTMILQKTQAEEIISALEMLGSRKVAEMVVDRLGAEAILEGEVPGTKEQSGQEPPLDGLDRVKAKTKQGVQTVRDSIHDALRGAGVKDELSDRELAIMELQDSVLIDSPRLSSVISIEAQSKTPEMAQLIVATYVDCFEGKHLDGAFTEGSLQFFEEEADAAEENLLTLEQERAEYKRKNKIVTIEGARASFETQLSLLERDLVIAEGELEQAKAESTDLLAKESEQSDEIVANQAEGTDPTWSGMRQRVYELEVQLEMAEAKYTEKHPELRRIKKALEGAQRILGEVASQRIDGNTTPNPEKIRIGAELQTALTKIAGLESAIEEKENRRTEMQSRIDDLLEYEQELLLMDREIRLTGESLDNLRQKEEEARVINQLHDEKISNLNVFQEATLVERPASPKKKTLAVGFLFLGLLSGFGLSVLRETSSRTLRSKEDVESDLGLPVIADIPRVSSVNRRSQRKLLREKCQPLIADVLLSRRPMRERRGRALGVIGVDVGAGASTIAVHTAIASSEDCHLQTMLVDADSRQRSVSKYFGLNGTPGLVELVGGVASHDECLQRAENADIDLVASAGETTSDVLKAEAPEIAQALQAYLQDTDLMIVDLPAASQPDQAVALAQHMDCVVVVVESERTQRDPAERLVRRLSQSDVEVVGVVLTKSKCYLPRVLRRFVRPQV